MGGGGGEQTTRFQQIATRERDDKNQLAQLSSMMLACCALPPNIHTACGRFHQHDLDMYNTTKEVARSRECVPLYPHLSNLSDSTQQTRMANGYLNIAVSATLLPMHAIESQKFLGAQHCSGAKQGPLFPWPRTRTHTRARLFLAFASSSRPKKQHFREFNSQFRWMPTFGMVPVGLGNQEVKGGGERGSLCPAA